MTTTLWFRLSASSSLVAVLCPSNVSFPSNETNPIGRCCRATKDNAGPPATTHSFPGNADEASARQLDAIPAAISGVTVDRISSSFLPHRSLALPVDTAFLFALRSLWRFVRFILFVSNSWGFSFILPGH